MNEQISRKMTPVRIIEPEGTDYAEVVFLESAQFYKLPKGNQAFGTIITLLRGAVAKKLRVEVRFASLASDIIEDVKMDL